MACKEQQKQKTKNKKTAGDHCSWSHFLATSACRGITSADPGSPMGCCLGVCVKLQLWTAQPPLAEWIRRGQPAHTPPQRPPGAERKGRPEKIGFGYRPSYCGSRLELHASTEGWSYRLWSRSQLEGTASRSVRPPASPQRDPCHACARAPTLAEERDGASSRQRGKERAVAARARRMRAKRSSCPSAAGGRKLRQRAAAARRPEPHSSTQTPYHGLPAGPRSRPGSNRSVRTLRD
eukprot:358814-Chlamydomonas_euryale.AAC.5